MIYDPCILSEKTLIHEELSRHERIWDGLVNRKSLDDPPDHWVDYRTVLLCQLKRHYEGTQTLLPKLSC